MCGGIVTWMASAPPLRLRFQDFGARGVVALVDDLRRRLVALGDFRFLAVLRGFAFGGDAEAMRFRRLITLHTPPSRE